MTSLPPDPGSDDVTDEHVDRASDDTAIEDLGDDAAAREVRRLLRSEVPTIDPTARERALAVAMAAAGEPPLTADPALPRPDPVAGSGSTTDVPTGTATAPRSLSAQRARRMRVLSVAAAVVVVVAGVAAVSWGQGLRTSSNSESAEDAATATSSAAADGAEREATAGGGANDPAQAPGSTTTTPPGVASSEGAVAAPGGLVDLGAFDDTAALFDAADAAIADSARAGTAEQDAALDQLVPCPDARASLGAEPVATATFRDAAVLVVRTTDARTLVLGVPSCVVLAQG